MKPLFIIFCLAILFSACSTSKQIPISEIHGKYHWQISYPNDVGANIQLNPNKTFEYNWIQGMLRGTTFGTWELNKNSLVLNSEKQPEKKSKEQIKREKEKERSHSLIINSSTNLSGLEIKVIDKESKEPLIFTRCSLVTDSKLIEETTADEFGVCMLSKSKQFEKLRIQYVGYEDAEISYYEYFTNRKWRVKGNRIYDPKIRTDKYAKKYYLKVVK